MGAIATVVDRIRPLAVILKLHAHEIVPRICASDFLEDVALPCGVAVQKIADQKHNRAPVRDVVQERQRRLDARAALPR